MAQKIQLRRDTAANWTAANPILAQGEVGFEIDTSRSKVGDGVTAWNSRPYTGVATAGWTQDGAGAVARTVDSKLKEVVSVKDFGAVGDGVTDDTTAIQTAINSAFTQQKILILPDGAYLVSATLNVPRPFELKGDGEILYTNNLTACLQITASTDAPVLIDGITLTGPFNNSPAYSANSNGVRISGTPASITNGAVFQNMTVQGFGDNGFRLAYCNNSVVQDCVIQRIGRTGIQWRSSKKALTLRNKIYDIAPGAGGNAPFLNAYGVTYTQANADTQVCEDGLVSDNYVENVISWTGIDTHGGQRITIKNNTVLNTYLGIVVMGPGGGSTATVSADFCVVQDNYVRRDPSVAPYSRAGIAVIPSSSGVSSVEAFHHSVTGNYIENHGGNSLTEGALLFQNTRRAVCTDNQIINPLGVGIQLGNSSSFSIYGGIVQGNFIHNVLTNTVDGTLEFLQLTPSSDAVAFTVAVSQNTFFRSAGNGTGIVVNNKPSGVSAQFGPILGQNVFIGFNEGNSSRLTLSSNTLQNVSSDSLSFCAPIVTSEVSQAGNLISSVRAFGSSLKLSTGSYRVIFQSTNFAFTSIDQYNVIVTPIDANPRICAITKQLDRVLVDIYDLSGALVDCQFSIQISRNLP